jgi:hypothetical protein
MNDLTIWNILHFNPVEVQIVAIWGRIELRMGLKVHKNSKTFLNKHIGLVHKPYSYLKNHDRLSIFHE